MPKFLTFNNYHLAPITGVDPEALKRSAKRACAEYSGSDEKLSYNLALNYIAKSFGFKGGFSGYKSEWDGKLSAFMQEKGLVFRENVLEKNIPYQCVKLTYRQIADRLFCSGRPLPKRIFVGVGAYDLLRTLEANDEYTVAFWPSYGGGPDNLPSQDVSSFKVYDRVAPASYSIWSKEGSFCPWTTQFVHNNLLGNQLCDMGSLGNDVVVCNWYNASEEEINQTEIRGKLFRQALEHYPDGWVEVVPYNDRLIFLKTPDGEYDFVFDGVRDDQFKKNPYAPYLRYKDISSNEEDSAFDRHLYFGYDGWLEADRHAAEIAFYANGGTPLDYPGRNKILKTYLVSEDRYSLDKRKYHTRPDYHMARVLNGELCFTDLVTVGKFCRFLKDTDYGYASHRKSCSDLDALNLDGDPESPVAVTWYDAMAYARWIKGRHKLPVRLPTEDEWLHLAGELIPEKVTLAELRDALSKRIIEFVSPDGEVFDGHPPRMNRDEFESLKIQRILENMPIERSSNRMDIVRSAWFGEWLGSEGAAINCLFGCSQYEVFNAAKHRISAERSRFSPLSMGKYKSMLICFRLVYEAEVRK